MPDPPVNTAPPTCECTPADQSANRHSAANTSPTHTAPLPADLQSLLSELDQFTEDDIPMLFLEKRLGELNFRLEDVSDFVKFDDHHYRRNLIQEGPRYHALLLCWKPGQRSPIHDHRGSACGVRVVKGAALETIFERTPEGHVYPTLSQELGEGFVCANSDTDIHQISNLQDSDRPLVTLHIYSPPLHVMGTYSLTTDEAEAEDYEDPVFRFEFMGGAGI